jgi:hypothetical protein
MIRKVTLVVLLSGICGVASANDHDSCASGWDGGKPNLKCTLDRDDHHKKTVTAPEIDSASAIAGLTFLLGGLAVLRGRRTKNSKAELQGD